MNQRRLPKPLRRLADALDLLDELGEPAASTPIGQRGSGAAEWAEPDAGRRHWRDKKAKWLKRIDRLASEILDDIRGLRRSSGAWQCRECGAGQRPQAKICDQCGRPRDAVAG